MEAASKALLERGNHVDARAIALKWVELVPLSEAAHRLAMRAIAKAGDRTGALQQYQTCERILRDELGVAPDAETISVLADIKFGLPSTTSHNATDVNFQDVVRSARPRQADADAPAEDGRPSIAVLPFENLSSDPEQEFLADGMADDIISGLSKYRWLFVIARRSSFTYKGQAKDVREIADDLGVRYVVEGSIRRAGNRIRVLAQLVDAETGNNLWSERYDRNLDDMFAVQDEVSGAIIREIAPEISDAEINRARRTPPENLDAWGAYQQGLALEPSGESADYEAAIAHFDRAITYDPSFVDALAMATLQRARMVLFFKPSDSKQILSHSERLIRSALRLDPKSAVARCARGRLFYAQGEFERAVSSCEEAVRLEPNCAQAHLQLGAVLDGVSRWQESLDAYEQVLRLSPRDPHIAAVYTGRAYNLFHLGRYEECVVSAQTALDSANPRYWASLSLIAGLSALGRDKEMVEAVKDLFKRKPDITISDTRRFPAFSTASFLEALRRAGIPD